MLDSTSLDRAIAQRIIEARLAAGLSKVELADRLGLSKQGYNHYESFDTPFSVQQVFRAARVLGRPVEWFLGLATELTEDEQLLLEMYRRIKAANPRDAGIVMRQVTAALPEE